MADFTKITAIIDTVPDGHSSIAAEVILSLKEIGVINVIVTAVKSLNEAKIPEYRQNGKEVMVFPPKIQLEVVVPANMKEEVINRIFVAAKDQVPPQIFFQDIEGGRSIMEKQPLAAEHLVDSNINGGGKSSPALQKDERLVTA